jgi:hypothetical protein
LISATSGYPATIRIVLSVERIQSEVQGDEAMELGVFGLVNNTHPAPPELFENAVVGNGIANHDEETSFREAIKVPPELT